MIRATTLTDSDAVTALFAASYPVLLAPFYDAAVLGTALPLMTKAQPQLLASGTFYVAEAGDGRIVSCGGWTLEQPGTALVQTGLAHIRHFATHPEHTRRGHARAVMQRCLADAAARGVRSLECQSTRAAEGFYAASGFKTVRAIDVQLPRDVLFPAILMRCELV